MGCDIHLYVEKIVEIEGEDKWCCCDHFKKNPFYGHYEDNQKWEHIPIYDDRDYSLFALLADVRSSWDIQPISEPRGLPDDVSKEVKAASDDWGVDGHSHSWLTAKELFKHKNEPQLKPLIKAVKRRMAEELYIYNFLDKERKKQAYKDHAEDFRIVFWFDN